MTAEQNPKRRKGLGVPLEVARAQLLENEETKELAEIFGVPVEEYVELVLEYAQNPQKEPILDVLDEEELAEAGADIPTYAEVNEYLRKLERGEIDLGPKEVFKDEVSDDKSQEVSKASVGLQHKLQAPPMNAASREVKVEQNDPMGSVLKQQLLSQRTRAELSAMRPNKKKQNPRGPR